MRRAATAQHMPTTPVPSPLEPQGFGRSYSPTRHTPATRRSAGMPATGSGTGSTMTGAVVGGIAGVAAGYALSKMLEDGTAKHPSPMIPVPAPERLHAVRRLSHATRLRRLRQRQR